MSLITKYDSVLWTTTPSLQSPSPAHSERSISHPSITYGLSLVPLPDLTPFSSVKSSSLMMTIWSCGSYATASEYAASASRPVKQTKDAIITKTDMQTDSVHLVISPPHLTAESLCTLINATASLKDSVGNVLIPYSVFSTGGFRDSLARAASHGLGFEEQDVKDHQARDRQIGQASCGPRILPRADAEAPEAEGRQPAAGRLPRRRHSPHGG